MHEKWTFIRYRGEVSRAREKLSPALGQVERGNLSGVWRRVNVYFMTDFIFYCLLALLFFRPLGDALPPLMGDTSWGSIVIVTAAVLALVGILWRGRVRGLIKPPAVHLLILSIFLVLSVNPGSEAYLSSIRKVGIVLCIYLIVSYIQELLPQRRKVAQVFWMIILSAIPPAILGIIEVLGGGGEVIPGLVPLTRAQSIMGDYVFAVFSFLSLACAVVFFLLDCQFSRGEKFKIIISIILSLISIVIAGYRSSLFATIIFMSLFIYLLSSKTIFRDLAKKLLLGSLVLMIFLASIIFSWPTYRERLTQAFDPDYYQSLPALSSISMRLLNLQLVVDQVAEAPFWGNGAGTFEIDQISGTPDAGSMYTLSLYEGGIPLLVAIILIAYTQITYCFTTLRKVQAANQAVLSAFMGALVISGLLLSLIDTFWFDSINGLRYWLALTLGYSSVVSRTKDQPIS